ncbi:hypothetical protein PAMC26577_34910 [Caballeronia sordidicola]|uniref:Uncharacterized protein n=1 Tax=Caballeronia sordidicola TaxID=196367 RepID=A0A242MBC0_CABSO|nr:hypothetical protein PAMC26577_34910 [Caballeronia sordidicola]
MDRITVFTMTMPPQQTLQNGQARTKHKEVDVGRNARFEP